MHKTVRVAMIGMGERGKQLMDPLLKMKDVQVVAVCDAYEDRTAAAAETVKKNAAAHRLCHRIIKKCFRTVTWTWR